MWRQFPGVQQGDSVIRGMQLFCTPQVVGVEDNAGRGSATRFCSDGAAGRLTGHFHGEEDDSNLGGMLRKCPSKEGFFEMPPELHWKRRNVEGGEKGSPMQRMASLKTKV